MIKQHEGEPRIVYLARVLHVFMEQNGIAAECTIGYDEAECDGKCLAADIMAEVNWMETTL